MSLGYFTDEYLSLFVSSAHVSRRPPLINRGYWARVAAVNQSLIEFIQAGENTHHTTPIETSSTTASIASPFAAPSRVPPPPFPVSTNPPTIRKQVLSLGAGSDTLYFKLKAAHQAPFRYVEVDFPVAAQRKAATIRRHPKLMSLVSAKAHQFSEEQHQTLLQQAESRAQSTDSLTASLALPSSDYTLLGADLRDLTAFEQTLREANFDFSLPTLILSECVLIYMPPTDSAHLLHFLTSRLTGGCMIWTYEQIHPFDAFGQTMISNLKNRGCSLLGFTAYPDLIAHRDRYLSCGFQYYQGWDMNDVYRYYLKPVSEVKRIERLELFDEFEEWNMIQAHYHVSVASKPPTHTTDQHASLINWQTIGMLGYSKTNAVNSAGSSSASSISSSSSSSNSGSVTLPNGKTIMLGGVRASAPLKPSDTTSNSMLVSGNLRKVGQ